MSIALKADRMTLSVGLSLSAVLILAVYLLAFSWMQRAEYVTAIDRIVPRTARLQGLLDREQDLATAAGGVEEVLGELAYAPGRDTATTAASMQQAVRDVLTDAGLSVSGSQILPAKQVDGFERLVLDVTALGGIAALEQALSGMQNLRPVALVETATIKPERSRRSKGRRGSEQEEARPLSIRLRILSLRLL